MSYREIRNFTEMMRSLGYARLISMENFRKPNFELVADILYWMVKLYDPETTIADRISDEDDRVEFLTDIASLLAAKARLKLNTKNLYAADGRAVRELLKLATLFYKASRSIKGPLDDTPQPPIKIQEVKAARTLASEITQGGAKLYDLLSAETKNRQERLQALRFMDQAGASSDGSKEQLYIQKSLEELVGQTRRAVEDMRKESEEMEHEELNLETKIKKRQEELERMEKRLRSLDNVRPQFLEEQDKLEKELQRQYDIYMEKYRTLDYLENELEQYHKAEEERKEEHDRKLKRMREKLLKEEVEVLRGNRRDDADEEYKPPANSAGRGNAGQGGMSSANSGGGSKAPARAATKVSGNMRRDRDSEEDSEEDSDANAGGNRGSDDSDGSYDDGELSVNSDAVRRAGQKARNATNARGGGAKQQIGSDNDDEFLDDEDGMDGEDDDGNDSGGSDEHF